MSRDYNFPLPKHFTSFEVGMAPGMLQAHGVWDDIPDDLKDKIMQARSNNEDIYITEEDLNSIPDEAWNNIYQVLFS